MKWKDAIKHPPPLYRVVLLVGTVASLPAELEKGVRGMTGVYMGWRWEATDPKKPHYCMLSRQHRYAYPAVKNVTHWAPIPKAPISREKKT